jgi:hypothetical protein
LIIPFCQLRAQIWPKIYGDDIHAYVRKTIEDYDKGYIIGGSVLSDPNTLRYAWIIKTDINGTELWDKKFGDGINKFFLQSCAKVQDSGFIISGGTSLEDPQYDPLFFKLNICGELEWCKIFLSDGHNEATDVVAVEGGYIGLLKYYDGGPQYFRISLVKMDKSGEPMWIQHLAQEDSLIFNEEGHHLLYSSDNNYLITGHCFQPGLRPFWIKADTSGHQIFDLIWQGGIGTAYESIESENNYFYSVGSFAETGMPFTPTLFKFDNDGNFIYKKYILSDTIESGESVSVCNFNDTTLLTGLIWGPSPNQLDEYYSEIFMLDTLGNVLNRKLLLNAEYAPQNIIKTFDNKIIVSGHYVVVGNWDIYMWKLNSDLEIDTLYTQPLTYDSLCPYQILSDTVDLDCSLFVNIDEIPTKEEYESTIKISPNPAKDWITLTLPDIVSSRALELAIFNIFGQEVVETAANLQNRTASLNVSALKSGFYLAVCKDAKGKVFNGKFVVAH